jgi:hypothetical protein
MIPKNDLARADPSLQFRPMHFPRYWSRGTWRGPDPDGLETSRTVWGWSDASSAEAGQRAEERARQLVEAAGQRGAPHEPYGYPDRLLREPVLRELSAGPGGAQAVVTRNAYGCEVLNADRVAFIDWDLPPAPGDGFFGSLFGRKKPIEDWRTQVEAEQIRQMEDFQRSHSELGFRVYRTAGGLRYLITTGLFHPDDPLVGHAMDAADADPTYRRLCEVQKSFRARLTPKPWRCGVDKPPHRFPYADAEQSAAMERWASDYATVATKHAVCLYLLEIGSAPVAAEVRPILDEHDRATTTVENRPLA